jgi:ABC-type transport system involved in multi-copper enzyme maturation permease subunit
MRPDIDIRSFLDTRGGVVISILSVLALIGTGALAGLAQPLFMPEGTSDLKLTIEEMGLPLTVILPIIAVLITAGEWSDRSIQVTLTQRAGRSRVMASKVLTATIVSVALLALAGVVALVATWAGGEWIGSGAVMADGAQALPSTLGMIGAVLFFSIAMGLLTQSTVLGLLTSIGLPFVVTTAGGLVALTGSETLTTLVRAFDVQSAGVNIGLGRPEAVDLVAVALLVAVPVVLGVIRWNRREVA